TIGPPPRQTSYPERLPNGDFRRAQVLARRLAAHSRRRLDSPQRPIEAPQGQNLLLLLFAQDVHPDGRTMSASVASTSRIAATTGRLSDVHHWPVLTVHRGGCGNRRSYSLQGSKGTAE